MATSLPKKLHLWTYVEYISDGVKDGFAREYGVEVVEDYYLMDGGDTMAGLFADPNVHMDLMVLAGYQVHMLANHGDLLPLDLSYIPNAANVIPKLEHPPFDTWPDGRRYSVPYQWYVTGIGVLTDKVQESITGWTDLWNPRYRGQIQMVMDMREEFGAALKKDGHSLNTRVQSELDQATQDLIKQKPLVLPSHFAGLKSPMEKGVPLTQCWSGDVMLARWAGLGPDELHFVLPQEGYGISVDNMCIHKRARNPYAAHLFMNYLCRPEVNAKLTNWNGYFSPIATTASLLNKTITALLPSEADLERGEIFNDLGDFEQN